MTDYQTKKNTYVKNYFKHQIYNHIKTALAKDNQFYKKTVDRYSSQSIKIYRYHEKQLGILEHFEKQIEKEYFQNIYLFLRFTGLEASLEFVPLHSIDKAMKAYAEVLEEMPTLKEKVKNNPRLSKEFKHLFSEFLDLVSEYNKKSYIQDWYLRNSYVELYEKLFQQFHEDKMNFLMTNEKIKDQYIKALDRVYYSRQDFQSKDKQHTIANSVYGSINGFYSYADQIIKKYNQSDISELTPTTIQLFSSKVRADVELTKKSLQKFTSTISKHISGQEYKTSFTNKEFEFLKKQAHYMIRRSKQVTQNYSNGWDEYKIHFTGKAELLNIYDRKVLNVMSSWKTFAKGLEVSQNATEFNSYLAKNF